MIPLLEIRDSRLYRDGFSTFGDYCRDRWEISVAHGKRLMAAAEVAYNLAPIGAIQPTHESQVRQRFTVVNILTSPA
jgi:hypothetical protein